MLTDRPPGTGKTKTISGLVGKFMSERKHSIRTDRPGQTTSAKLLVCAPSNAAIDEVTKRLKVGVPLGRGHIFKPKIVRIGAEASMNAAVVDVGLDALVEARMSAFKAAKGGDKGGSEISKAEAALDQIRQDREAKQKDLQILGDADPERKKILEADLQRLVTQRLAKSAALNKARDAARDFGRQIDAARREARDKIIEEADIICATLAGAGHDSLKPFDFGTVIIDEAAQAIELSTLIPLKYRCTRCILVGGKSVGGFCRKGQSLITCPQHPRSKAIASNRHFSSDRVTRLQRISVRPTLQRSTRLCPSPQYSISNAPRYLSTSQQGLLRWQAHGRSRHGCQNNRTLAFQSLSWNISILRCQRIGTT